MKARICGVCLKSGMLCRTCREAVEKGGVSEAEVRVSRLLFGLSDKVRNLKDITVKNVLETGGLLVIVCERGEAARMIGKSGNVVRRLEKELGKRVSIVEEAPDARQFIAGLLHPTPVVGVNVLYRGGGEMLKVMVGGGSARLPLRDFREIIRRLYGKEVEIEES